MKYLSALAGLLSGAIMPSVAHGEPLPHEPTWLQLEYELSAKRSDGQSSGTSRGRQALIETVMEERPDGVVLQYDLPHDEEDKASSGFWYFPARVVERQDGSLELLDQPLVEARIDRWLKTHKIPKEACGMWSHGGGFPFKVDCDPQSILDQIEAFDLRIPDLMTGADYSHALDEAPGTLKALPAARSGYSVTFTVDQSKARAGEVANALILAQMLGKDLTRQQAEEDAEKIGFQGSIMIEFDLDPAGTVIRKQERIEIMVTRPDEEVETKTSLIIVTRLGMEDALEKFAD
jgi:hypothetical protein|tara:strand:- start:28305 stop:29177 length:873 start_codon:yes stop_codon:yes gene_type:complete